MHAANVLQQEVFKGLLGKANDYPLNLAHTDEFPHVLQTYRDNKLHRDDDMWGLYSRSRQPIWTWHLPETGPRGTISSQGGIIIYRYRGLDYGLTRVPHLFFRAAFSNMTPLDDIAEVQTALRADQKESTCRYL